MEDSAEAHRAARTAAHVEERKRELRTRIRALRRARGDEDRRAAAEALAGHLTALVHESGARTVTAYRSTASEPGTGPFLARMRAAGIRVLLPVSRPDGLLDWAVDSDGPERAGLFGIAEPAGGRLDPDAARMADLMLIPAAAVGSDGIRLGWGRGYFDRMLADVGKCPPVYAVVFDGELVDEVPCLPHDRAVDGVVTPSGIVRLP